MYVVIMGAGRFGLTLAKLLVKKDCDITLIEKNENLCTTASLELDATVIHGSGSDSEILEEINIEEADYFIAASGVDEANLLACVLVNNYNVPNIVARVSTNTNEDAFKKVGITHVINPEQAAAQLMKTIIIKPHLKNVIDLKDENAEIINLIIKNKKVVGKKIQDISPGKDYIIIGIYKDEKLKILQKNDVLKENEEIAIFLKKDSIKEVTKIFEK